MACSIILILEIISEEFIFLRLCDFANWRENKVLANKKCFTVTAVTPLVKIQNEKEIAHSGTHQVHSDL